MEATSPSGEIHVIVGLMFAGKTTALLRWLQSKCDYGRKVAVIISNKDIRHCLDSVVTHDGAKMPCWALLDLTTFKLKLGAEEYEQGLMRVNFLGTFTIFCSEAADHDGKTVIVASLDGDYLRRNFGSVLDRIPLADSVTKLASRCVLCGKRAFFTLKKTEETQAELIGWRPRQSSLVGLMFTCQSADVTILVGKWLLKQKKMFLNLRGWCAPVPWKQPQCLFRV